MKTIVLILAVGVGVYFAYNHFQNPAEIQNPVYGELRVDMNAGSRKINMILFAKMANEAECKERSKRVWEKMIENCKDCSMQLVDCKPELAPRYEQLFEDVPINIAYLSLNRGSRFERDGRMVIWGVTGTEGDQLCEIAKASFQNRYSGQIRCVASR